MKLLKRNESLKTGERGQIALFVALIFQILFLFFAMIINVGLVVHHKINLQSSVDMAAYYGAMKQAELLNSIAHINYQMRQSWKLLAWRYRVLGSAGDDQLHPYNFLQKRFREGMDIEYSNVDTDPQRGNFIRPPFCITYNPFNESLVPPGESTCKKTLNPAIQQQIIRLFNPPAIAAGFINFANVTKQVTLDLKRAALNRCQVVGTYNYIIVGSFMLAYQIDQYVRRVTISRISRSMSERKGDFLDIDGKSTKTGAEETFRRNLSEPNRESRNLTFDFYNGLANPACGNIPSDQETPAPWLAEIRVFPSIFYLDLDGCDDGDYATQIAYTPKSFDLINPGNIDDTRNESSIPFAYFRFLNSKPDIKNRIRTIAQSLSLYNDRYRFLIGFEKNPWCQAYVGVKATANPRIPFAPTDLTLTASAYAKPFGGQIGPWYYKNWNKGTPESTGNVDDRTDTQLPLRVKDFATLQSDATFFANPLRIANYSKYIGDKYGLMSWRTLGHMARAVFNLTQQTTYRSVAGGSSVTDNKILASRTFPAPRLEDWDLISNPVEENRQKDILAWNNEDDRESGMRILEIAGLAPDQFDISYFSIEPNFYENYYNRLKNGLIKAIGLDENFLRPDLGARIGHPELEKFSVKDQIKIVKDVSQNVIDFKEKLTYNVLNAAHLLTSWSNKSLFSYDKIDDGFFGSCSAPVIDKNNYTDPKEISGFLKPDESVPGECITGGRTGYSVKLISKDYLFSNVKAAGASSTDSTILNPPTDF